VSVAQIVQALQRFDRLSKNSFAALRVGFFFEVVGEAGHHFDAMRGQKLREVALRGEQQHREIAAIDHVTAQRMGPFHQAPEAGAQLGCAAGDIDRWNFGTSKGGQTQLGRFG
jgi:hypothetical protein